MKAGRFLFAVAIVFVGLGALYLAAFRLTWSQPMESPEALRDVWTVKTRLAAGTASPRWLIVGGSSAWFGFDSGLLEKAVQQNVVNLGAHAELPLWFQLEAAERLARPGDTVLLAAELVHYWRARPTTFGAAKLGVLDPEAFARATWSRKAELLGAIPPSYVVARLVARRGASRLAGPAPEQLMANLQARWAGTFAGEVPGYYSYLDLDAHGDFARPRATSPHDPDDYGLADRHELPRAIWADLAASAHRLRGRGVTCRFTWPPFERQAKADLGSAAAQANFAAIRAGLEAAGWHEASRVEDSILAPEFFYDTPFHLTTAGAQERTLRLAQRLRATVPGP